MAVAEHHRPPSRRPSEPTTKPSSAQAGRRAAARGVLRGHHLAFLIPLIWMLFGSVRRETEIFGMLYPFGWHTFFRSSGRWSTSGTSSA